MPDDFNARNERAFLLRLLHHDGHGLTIDQLVKADVCCPERVSRGWLSQFICRFIMNGLVMGTAALEKDKRGRLRSINSYQLTSKGRESARRFIH